MGWTLEELSEKMTNQEFELHMALAMLKNDECPNCGVEPRDMGEFTVVEVKCPVCRQTYHKTRYQGSFGHMSDDYKD